MIDVRVAGQSLRDLLSGPPVLTDSFDAVCTTLDLALQDVPGIPAMMGQVVEVWVDSTRWYYGRVLKHDVNEKGEHTYTAYDPLYSFSKNPDDYYFKNQTATQILRSLAGKVGVTVGKLENTGAVLGALYYQAKDPDKIGTDALARTMQLNGRKFRYRFNPEDSASFGLNLLESKVPAEVWAFQRGVNLTAASYSEDASDIANVVKLVNRETGKVVVKTDAASVAKYGHMQSFDEVAKDKAATMDKDAVTSLKKSAAPDVSQEIEAINPGIIIPRLYHGDAVYVEEKTTGIVGGYYLRSVTHNFVNDDLVTLSMAIEKTPDLPEIQYDDATKKPGTNP